MGRIVQTCSETRNQIDVYRTSDVQRSARRQRLAEHIHQAGPRPVLEALLAVENGEPLDDVLEDFGRIPVSTYMAVGANELPINRPLGVVDGGRNV